jgi:hypothetical protein
LDEFEITCIVKDMYGIISHLGVKGYGVQNVIIIEKLIREKACAFFIYDGEKKRNVCAKKSPDGTTYLTTDLNRSDMKGLEFLPLFDRPLLKQLIESVR